MISFSLFLVFLQLSYHLNAFQHYKCISSIRKHKIRSIVLEQHKIDKEYRFERGNFINSNDKLFSYVSNAALHLSLLASLLAQPMYTYADTGSDVSISIPAKMDSSQTFVNNDAHFQFQYPNEFTPTPKLVKTHKFETLISSMYNKGFLIGVTVDPVRKISSVNEFASASDLAKKVLAVEEGKEGFKSGKIIQVKETKVPVNDIPNDSSTPAYDLEYMVETSRGTNHYYARVAIHRQLLYVFTIQFKEETSIALYDKAINIASSFILS